MSLRDEFGERDAEAIAEIAEALRMSEPDLALIVKKLMLEDPDTFARAAVPVIAVTGVTHTGKSSLINALFDEKGLTAGLLKVGQTTDTTDLIVQVRFKSGLLLYDTPGGGGNEKHENITRAFLGIKQLEEDVQGNSLKPLDKIATADAATYNPQTNRPIRMMTRSDLKKIDLDLVVFVVSVESGLRRDDIRFFYDIVSRTKLPVIVAINKIDLADKEKVEANKNQIVNVLQRDAIPISAKTGEGLETLAVAIQKALPRDQQRKLGETVDIRYRKILQDRQIEVESIVAAVKVAEFYDPSTGQASEPAAIASYAWALYGLVARHYVLSEQRLAEQGLNVVDLWRNIERSLKEHPTIAATTTPLTLAGLAVGTLTAAVVSGGFVVPLVLVGALAGSSVAGAAGFLRGRIVQNLKRKEAIASEFEQRGLVSFNSSRLDAAASILAFGRSLKSYCEMLGRLESEIEFGELFKKELASSVAELRPFAEQLNSMKNDNGERLIKEIVATLVG